MKFKLAYPVEGGLVRLDDKVSIPEPQFRERLAELGVGATSPVNSQGLIEVTVDVAVGGIVGSERRGPGAGLYPDGVEFH